MNKLYDRIYWHNNTTPALNESNLNAMSKAIDDIDDRVIQLADDVVDDIADIHQWRDDCEGFKEDSEAWAVGTRDGVPVSSDDPTYHNNSKWYSEHIEAGLGDLSDVELSDVQDGETILYDAQTQTFKNGVVDFGLFVKNGMLMCRFENA